MITQLAFVVGMDLILDCEILIGMRMCTCYVGSITMIIIFVFIDLLSIVLCCHFKVLKELRLRVLLLKHTLLMYIEILFLMLSLSLSLSQAVTIPSFFNVLYVIKDSCLCYFAYYLL